MKYLFLILFLFSGISNACVVGPKRIIPTEELGFKLKEEPLNSCLNCKTISITVPKNHENKPVAHAIFTIFQNGEMVSKTIAPFKEGFNENEFFGIVGDTNYFNYTVEIEYGHYRCMSYQFNYSGGKNGS